jgi:hypothetical protein
MCRGPLAYGHAGATRIFSDSAGSFARRGREEQHTNEREHGSERCGNGCKRKWKPSAVTVHEAGRRNRKRSAQRGDRRSDAGRCVLTVDRGRRRRSCAAPRQRIDDERQRSAGCDR